jgi:hypothetical protein
MATTHTTNNGRKNLSSFEKSLRSNIRNAYFCEDTDVILDQINQRLAQGEKFEAACLRELLDEALEELFETTK